MTLESAVVDAASPQQAAPRLMLRNIAELRLLFAGSVMFSHAALLLDPGGMRLLRTVLNSEAAVQGFFILSGFLVCGSYSRLRSPGQFWRRRLWRIYPGYACAVLVFVTLALAQSWALGPGPDWSQVGRYLVANLTTLNFIQPDIPGVFADNPLSAINGALWSIKVELMFYAILPLAYAIGTRISFGWLAALMIVAGALWWPILQAAGSVMDYPVPLSLKFQLPGQLHYFGLGVALFARARGHIGTASFAALVLLMLAILAGVGEVREAVQAAVLALVIGLAARAPQLPSLTGSADLSYGIYLAHFPIIQILLAAGAGALAFGGYLAAVVALTIAYALFSWFVVEKPALARGQRP